MMIHFDQSDESVVVTCDGCAGHWASFQWTMPEAEATALAHEARTHPDVTELRDRIATRERVRQFRRRAAV